MTSPRAWTFGLIGAQEYLEQAGGDRRVSNRRLRRQSLAIAAGDAQALDRIMELRDVRGESLAVTLGAGWTSSIW